MFIAVSPTAAVRTVRNNASIDPLGAATLASLEKLPEWKASPEVFTTALKPYFENLTANLSVPANSKVSVTSVLKDDSAYIAWMQANRVLEKTRDAYPVGDLTRVAMELQIKVIAQLKAQVDEVLKDVPGFLKARGLTERQVLAQQISPALMARYDAGTLTIADVCREQPEALFVFSRDKQQGAKMQRAA